jgi:hypothetical protein
MTIKNPQPLQINGVEYGLLSVALAMSNRLEGEEILTDVNMVLAPYRNRPRGPEILETGLIKVNVAGALNDKAKNIKGTDPELAIFINSIENAIERYLKAKVK